MEDRVNQLESWNNCVKNALTKYKLAENNYRTQRLKAELIYEGVISNTNQKYTCKNYLQAKNMMQLAISHLHWAQDGLNDFMDQHPRF